MKAHLVVYLLGLFAAFLAGAYVTASQKSEAVPLPEVSVSSSTMLKEEYAEKIAQLITLGNQFKVAQAERETLSYMSSEQPEVKEFLVTPASANEDRLAAQIAELAATMEAPVQILTVDLDSVKKTLAQWHRYRERAEMISKN